MRHDRGVRADRAAPRRPGHPVLARLAFYGVVILVALPATFCHVLTRAPGGSGDAPGTGFEESAHAAGGLEHRAFLSPGDPTLPGFVIVHGLGDSPGGMEHYARRFVERGHSVVLPELRGHGASSAATTLGGREREEVAAAADLLAGHQPGSRLVLMGFSLGSVATLGAAAGREDLAAVIVEAPYDSYRETVAHHAGLLYGMPRWLPLIPLSIGLAELWADFDADAIDAVAAAAAVRAPLFVIADGADPRMPPEVVTRVHEAHPGPGELWVVPAADHIQAVAHPDYWPRVLSFLERHGVVEAPPSP
jgi:pimeloyl-ACP methyl ester carboxylesterase